MTTHDWTWNFIHIFVESSRLSQVAENWGQQGLLAIKVVSIPDPNGSYKILKTYSSIQPSILDRSCLYPSALESEAQIGPSNGSQQTVSHCLVTLDDSLLDNGSLLLSADSNTQSKQDAAYRLESRQDRALEAQIMDGYGIFLLTC